MTRSTVILGSFQGHPFGDLVAEQISNLGVEVRFLEELDDDTASNEPGSHSGLHSRAWAQRKLGQWSSTLCYKTIDLDHLLGSCDRVFLQPQPVSDVLGYLGALGRMAKEWLKQFPGGTPMIFLATPHFPADLMTALVAQEMGNPVFVVRTSLIDGYVWFGKLQGTQICGIADFGTGCNFREQIGSGESFRLEVSRAMNTELKAYRRSSIRRSTRLLCHRLARLFLPDFVNIKLGIQPLRRAQNHYWSHLGRWKMAFVRVVFRFHVLRVRRYLQSQTQDKLSQRYIYVPLHFQPERSTNPEGGEFRNQIALVREVSDLLRVNEDLDVSIVVKDHPRQNSGDIRQLLQRDCLFYETLTSLHGVKIVGDNFSSDELISNAKLVVSVNGSSAWEALQAGVPSLTGVVTWHSACRASPPWQRIKEDPDLLRVILSMTHEEVSAALSEFLDSPSCLVTGSISHKHIPPTGQGMAIAQSMADYVQKMLYGDALKWREVT